MLHIVKKITPSIFDGEMDATNIEINNVKMDDILIINNNKYIVTNTRSVADGTCGTLTDQKGNEYYYGVNMIDYTTDRLTINSDEFGVQLSPIKKIIAIAGCSAREFALTFGIPVRTIENWCSGANNPPNYVLELCLYKVKSQILLDLLEFMPKNKSNLEYALSELIEGTKEFQSELVPFESVFSPTVEQIELMRDCEQFGDVLLNVKKLEEYGNKEQISCWNWYRECYHRYRKTDQRIEQLKSELKSDMFD